MSFLVKRVEVCPRCGKPMQVTEHHNVDKPISPDDLELWYHNLKVGLVFKPVPHIDIGSECMVCDYKSHESRDIETGKVIFPNGRLQ